MTDTTESIQATVDKRVEQFIDLRDKIKEVQDKHEAELKPLLEVKEMLAGWLQTFMEKSGCDKVGTPHGTAHFTTRVTASVADPALFMNYVIDTQMFDLLDRRANATAVKEYVETHKALPPGVN